MVVAKEIYDLSSKIADMGQKSAMLESRVAEVQYIRSIMRREDLTSGEKDNIILTHLNDLLRELDKLYCDNSVLFDKRSELRNLPK